MPTWVGKNKVVNLVNYCSKFMCHSTVPAENREKHVSDYNFLPVSFLTSFPDPKAVVLLYLLKPKAMCKTFSPISDHYVRNILELSWISYLKNIKHAKFFAYFRLNSSNRKYNVTILPCSSKVNCWKEASHFPQSQPSLEGFYNHSVINYTLRCPCINLIWLHLNLRNYSGFALLWISQLYPSFFI